MLSTVIRAVRRACAPVALAAALLPAMPAAGQSWSAGGCASCHGVVPTIAASVPDGGCSSYTIGIGESWMSSAMTLRDRVHTAGSTCGVPNMNSSNFIDGSLVWNYFVNLRDGTVAGAAPTIGSSKVGVSRDVSFSFTLTNHRNVATSFTVAASGGDAGDFQLIGVAAAGAAGCSGSTLPAASTESGVSCTVSGTVRFTPSASGARSTTLVASLATAPAGTTKSVYGLNGTGALPSITISPPSADFTAKVGTSAQQTFTVSNPGSVPLDLTSIVASPSPRYSIAGGTCSTAGTSNVAADGGNCTVIVAFAPTATGAAPAGSLSIGHDAGNTASPRTVTLSGTGTAPAVFPSTSTLNLGSSQFGVPRLQPNAIMLTNTGDATLVFPASPFTASGSHSGDFGFSGCAGSTLNPGGSCSISVTFTPGGLGARNASLAIASDASNGTVNVTLAGTGVALPEPSLTAQASIAAFPDTVIGEVQATARDLVIQNDRERDITYSVANTANFRLRSRTPGACSAGTVPGQGSCTLSFEFAPPLAGGEGTRQEALSFVFGGTGGDAAPATLVRNLSGAALLPLGLSATTLTPSARLTLPSSATSMVLRNRGSAALALGTIAFTGAHAAEYSLDPSSVCANGLVLAAGASCQLVLRFDPAATGGRNATMTIGHGGLGSPQSVSILGTATPAPQGRLELSATALAFPDTQLQSSTSRPITVSNAGDLALSFSGLSLGGAQPGDFSRAGSCAVGQPLAVGASCTLEIGFAPTALGARSASLTVASDSSTGPVTIALTGTGVPIPAPAVGFSPAALDFGAQTVGGLYPPRSVRLSNTGTAALQIGAITVQGSAFTSTSNCPATLAPGAGCDVELSFVPATAGGTVSASLRVTSNAAGSPHELPLSGSGSAAALPVLVWNPARTTVDFGNVSAGSLSTPQTVTLQNQGPGGVTLNLLNAVGPDAALFVVDGGSCSVGLNLFEGQSCTLAVRFAPAVAGARSATLQVATNGSYPPPLSLAGTGLGGPTPTAALSASSLGFDTTRLGAQSLPQELTISSSGSGQLEVSAIEIEGPYAMQLRSCPALPFTLPAGGACTVSLSFQPQATGTAGGRVRILSSASAVPLEVMLSGTGEPKADLSSGGGCSLVEEADATDPTLWALLLGAAGVLAWRRRADRRRRNA